MMMLRAMSVAVTLAIATPTMADDTLHSVINVDLIPSRQADGTRILIDYVQAARRDAAVLSVTPVRQFGSTSHFILVQALATTTAYEGHDEAG